MKKISLIASAILLSISAYGADTIVGDGATYTGTGAYNTIIGENATASGFGSSTVVGSGAIADFFGGTAIGNHSVSTGFQSTALGSGATASGMQSVAIGAVTIASGANSIAIGEGTIVNTDDSLAIGIGAQANANNSTAIGTYSITNEADTVSFGNAWTKRRLVNISDGIDTTDATTIGQFNTGLASTLTSANAYADTLFSGISIPDFTTQINAGDASTLSSANSYTDNKIGVLKTYVDAGDEATLASAKTYADAGDEATLASANNYANTISYSMYQSSKAYTDLKINQLDHKIEDVRDEARRGTALAIALSTPIQFENGHENALGAQIGTFKGSTALGVTYARRVDRDVFVNVGFSSAGAGNTAGKAGLNWSF